MALIKTPKEIEYIKTACQVTDEIFKATLLFMKKNKNVTEIDVRDYIVSQIKARKLRPSFPPIVTCGKRAGNDIHPQSTKSQLEGFLIIDLGVRVGGYCSDMTRTIYVGSPSVADTRLYEKVLEGQLLGIKYSRAGARCSDIDHAVRTSFGVNAQYFIHTLGHGVGRKIHESPIIYEKRTKPLLREGMVITIEPGVYIKNKLGIRIEDTILITQKQPQILTKTPKKLVCIS